MDNFIAVDDPESEIKRKLRKAFCPLGEATDNPVLELYQYLIFPRYPEVVIKRPEKYGGDLEYGGYDALEKDFVRGEVHPQDLKESAARYVSDMLSPVRDYLK
jgi:tyrosyl-tRNA synthetase